MVEPLSESTDASESSADASPSAVVGDPEQVRGEPSVPTRPGSLTDPNEASERHHDPPTSLARVVLGVLLTTLVVTLASYLAPEPYQATAVGLLFLGATYVLVLRHSASFVAAHGLSMGGLFEPSRLSLWRMLTDALRSLAWALTAFAIVAIPFSIGFRIFFDVHRPFAWHSLSSAAGALSGQLLVIALPEEAFFRGFLQSELEPFFARRARILGADISMAIVVGSAIFALGHLFTNVRVSRLAVFFPSLLFGFLRTRTRGIGAGLVFHALCNILSATLAQGYGLG